MLRNLTVSNLYSSASIFTIILLNTYISFTLLHNYSFCKRTRVWVFKSNSALISFIYFFKSYNSDWLSSIKAYLRTLFLIILIEGFKQVLLALVRLPENIYHLSLQTIILCPLLTTFLPQSIDLLLQRQNLIVWFLPIPRSGGVFEELIRSNWI